MKYRRLGKTGFEVSDIAHGLWGMSGWSGSEDAKSLRALQRAVDLGCNFFDTAWAYGDGHSDLLLGQIISQNRQRRLYAASKIPPLNEKWPASAQDDYREVFPTDHVFRHAELIRRNLGVEAIDLLQFHVWDDHWAEEPEFRRTVEGLKGEGIIRFFGLSVNRWQPNNCVRAIKTGLVDSIQVIYNIFDQSPEDELFPLCREMGIGIIARVPLDEGSLGGKMGPDTRFASDDWRSKYFGPDNLRRTLERVERLKPIVPPGMTLPEMALRFILSTTVVGTTIVGMREPEHVDQNLALSDRGGLPPALIAQLRQHRWNRVPQAWSD